MTTSIGCGGDRSVSGHPSRQDIEVDICDAESGDILHRTAWTRELAGLVRDVVRSCRDIDPSVQVRFPPGKVLRIVFPHPVDLGMSRPVRELWIVLPHASEQDPRVVCFDPEHQMTVYRPSAPMTPLRRWVDRHPGQGSPAQRTDPFHPDQPIRRVQNTNARDTTARAFVKISGRSTSAVLPVPRVAPPLSSIGRIPLRTVALPPIPGPQTPCDEQDRAHR